MFAKYKLTVKMAKIKKNMLLGELEARLWIEVQGLINHYTKAIWDKNAADFIHNNLRL